MSKSTSLFLYTVTFPNELIEPYLLSEVPVLSEHFEQIVILPQRKMEVTARLPRNVSIVYLTDLPPTITKFGVLSTHPLLILRMLVAEMVACKSKVYFLRRFRLTLSELLNGILLGKRLKAHFASTDFENAIHYSFWMNEPALALSYLRRTKAIARYVFRVHGFDLYEERWPHQYIPFRTPCYKYSSGIFAVSDKGLSYICERFGHYSQARCSYLGTPDKGLNPFDNGNFVIVTCSTIVPLKRLDLVASALELVKAPITWYHFGTGSVEQLAKLKKRISVLPKHIKVRLMGQVRQHELSEFYRNTPVSLLVNVSESEGLPVSMMEAISFGIPILGTNVGGVAEIVTPETGWLVHEDIGAEDLANKIQSIRNEVKDWPAFRAGVRAFWDRKFNSKRNYTEFCKQLLELK